MPFIHKNLLLSCLLLTAATYAEEETPPPQEEHAPVGIREMDPEKREWMEKQRALESGEEEEKTPADFRKVANTPSEGHFSLAPRAIAAPRITFASYRPILCHTLVSLAMTGDSVETEDGAHWRINAADAYHLSAWMPGDQLVITPNTYWFSSYDYYITNKRTGTYVKADLCVGPLQYGPYSHWIIGMDYYSGHIFLENGTTWCVHSSDAYVFRDWAINDHIILGVNDAWLSCHDYILINVNMDNYIRARQY